MRIVVPAALIAAAGALSACGAARGQDGGPSVSRSYPVGNFNAIELGGHYDVQVRTGAQPSVSARGPEKMMERLVVEVRGNTLMIRPRQDRGWFSMGWRKRNKVEVTITVPALEEATLAGSGDIRIDRVRGERFAGEIAGSGALRLDSVEVGKLTIGIAGSGDASLGSGKARSAEIDIAGSGGVKAQGVSTEELKVSIAGSGDVRAHATGAASVDIVGSGDVEISGGAKCSVSKAGSGNVRCS